MTHSGIVVYPFGYGIRRVPRARFRWRHRLISLPPACPRADEIEAFFTLNRDNPELFNRGVQALTENLHFFDQPIKLPILKPISPDEFEQRWREFVALLRAGDLIKLIDTASTISRLIAHLDHGVWSHSATYVGDGTVCEAITSGVVERSIEVYHSPRFRLGLYRLRPDPTPERPARMVDLLRSQIGSPYNWAGVSRLALGGLLKCGSSIRLPSPNDSTFLLDVALVHLVSEQERQPLRANSTRSKDIGDSNRESLTLRPLPVPQLSSRQFRVSLRSTGHRYFQENVHAPANPGASAPPLPPQPQGTSYPTIPGHRFHCAHYRKMWTSFLTNTQVTRYHRYQLNELRHTSHF